MFAYCYSAVTVAATILNHAGALLCENALKFDNVHFIVFELQ